MQLRSCYVSIIIPVYNAENSLDRLLVSLLDQDFHKDQYEIIAVDNNSSDTSATIISRYDVTYCFESQPSSYKARNKGAQQAKGNILAFIDSDVVADPGWLSAGIECLEHCDIAGGQIYPMKSGKKYFYLLDKVILNPYRNLSCKHKSKGITGVFFCKKVVFDGVGGFVDELISGGDTIFGLSAKKLGFALGFAKGAVVYHPVDGLKKRIKRAYRLAYGCEAKRDFRSHREVNKSGVKTLHKYLNNQINMAKNYLKLIRKAYVLGQISGFDSVVVFLLAAMLQFHALGAIVFNRIIRQNRENLARW